MTHDYISVKVAATQIAPCYLDLPGSVDKACQVIGEAASNGAKLVGFPEGYLCGYPWWIFMGAPFPYGIQFYEKLYRNSFTIPGPEMSRIAACARENGIYVCISGTERDGGSLYLSQVWFDDRGNLLGKHRKIRPTNGERTIWGEGDGSTMPVFETPLGNLGGLMCWEHRMPTNLMIMNAKNEQVHVASWPAGAGDERHVLSSRGNILASEYYASTVGAYVLMCTLVNTPDAQEMLSCGDPEKADAFHVGGAHAGIIDPAGNLITPLLPHDQEGILYADIDLAQIIPARYLIDCSGHYGKASVAQIIYNQESQQPVRFVGTPQNNYIPYDALTELS